MMNPRNKAYSSFSVDRLTIIGVFRSLSPLRITSEAKENLAVLKIAVLQVLEAHQEVLKPNPFKKLIL